MPVEMAMWKMTSDGPLAIAPKKLNFEDRLEELVVNDPSLINLSILVIGHQIPTKYGGYIDVLSVDVEGRIHVIAQAGSDAPRGRRPDPRLWLVGSGPESQRGHRAPGGEALTGREREVLALVAKGQTNRGIGTLFISEKTAAVHVSNWLASSLERSYQSSRANS